MIKDGKIIETSTPCTKCPEGNEPYLRCSIPVNKTILSSELRCVPCKPGYYQHFNDSMSPCRPCVWPSKNEHKVIIQDCSPTTPVISACKKGFERDPATGACKNKCCPGQPNVKWSFRKYKKCHKFYKVTPFESR